MDLKLGGKYKMGKKLGSGAFGDVYIAKETSTGEEVAIKVESNRTRHPQLLHEAKLIKMMKGKGIPELKGAIIEGDYNVMVMQLLGPSLENLFKYCKNKFSLHTTLMFGIQALERIEHVQSCDFLHRDIKPDNFVIGHNKASMVYMIDFGLAKRFRNPKTGQHIPWKEGKNLTGTARYASLNTHLGYEQSRRDDLEGLAYVMLYFLKGKLPWQGLPAKTKKEKYDKIKEKKKNTPVEDLCYKLPKEFAKYLNYCRSLNFEDKPCVSDLRKLFKNLISKKGLEYDLKFDWITKKSKMPKEIGYEDEEAEETDYKKKLKDLFG
jgi:serine/threonine protein kinase